MNHRLIPETKTIALVAHDHKKDELIRWAERHKDKLSRHRLIATGTTGGLIEERLGLPVQRTLSGPLGGDQQIGAKIAEGLIDIVVFFWDPMEMQPHDSDVKALLRLCVAYNIPMACDASTADFIFTSPHMEQNYEAEVQDYKDYLQRKV
ncbi:MAG: methylglyoxal synthase [Chryseobacterium sp.]|nr:MAG: methylglyoxal synthase [Chryseobacterium sp.]